MGPAIAAAAPALATNPVGWAVLGASSLVQPLIGIFQHHDKAVKTEAAALNTAVPEVESAWKGILDYVNAGSIGSDQAKQALDATIPAYESVVYDQYQVKRKSGNGPAVVEDFLKSQLAKVEGLISSGASGTVHLDSLPSHAGFQGAQAMDLNFQKPSGGVTSLQGVTGAANAATGGAISKVSAATGVPSWAVLAGAVLLLLLVVKAIR